MSLTVTDIVLALSVVICGLLGVARALIRQLKSMDSCFLGFVFMFIVIAISAEVIPTRTIGAVYLANPVELGYLGLLLTLGFL